MIHAKNSLVPHCIHITESDMRDVVEKIKIQHQENSFDIVVFCCSITWGDVEDLKRYIEQAHKL